MVKGLFTLSDDLSHFHSTSLGLFSKHAAGWSETNILKVECSYLYPCRLVNWSIYPCRLVANKCGELLEASSLMIPHQIFVWTNAILLLNIKLQKFETLALASKPNRLKLKATATGLMIFIITAFDEAYLKYVLNWHRTNYVNLLTNFR